MSNAPASIEKIQSALGFLNPFDRDMWVKCAMSIKSELGDEGFWLWNEWSQGADNYSDAASKSTWKSIKSGAVGIGTLFFEAKQNGWKWDKPEAKLSKSQIEKLKAESKARVEKAEAERKAAQEQAAVVANAIWNAADASMQVHPYLTKKQVQSFGLRIGKWEITDHETGEIKTLSEMALLIPIKDRTGKIHSLQAIFPNKIGSRDKDYLKGGAKSGNFFPIGSPREHNGQRVFILVEGYATAASIHQATGHCTITCFDTSNLITVATAIRERQPDAIILIAADNDQWTKRPDGTPYNPGVESAKKSADAVGGLVAVPRFASLEGQPTDFNDLHVMEGLEAVSEQILAALNGGGNEPEVKPVPEPLPDPAHEPERLPEVETTHEPAVSASTDKYFTILGYDQDDYYFFVHSTLQVLKRKRVDFNEMGLLELANDINWWEMNWPKGKGGVDTRAVFSWVYNIAVKRGVYDHNRVRGRGAWIDNNRAVYHLGGALLVDGEEVKLNGLDKSYYIYPRRCEIGRPSNTPLTAEEGKALFEIAKMMRWNRSGSALLMCGWVFLAPICGSLKWRPHIWIYGGSGSGKTTIQRDFCHALTRSFSIYAQGNSTEAGIRQSIKHDALPVLIEEIESNDNVEKNRVETILSLMRQSSSESQAKTLRGSSNGEAVDYHIRSMFCLASINTNLDKQADKARVTKLSLREQEKTEIETKHWRILESKLHEIVSDELLPDKMLARSQSMILFVQDVIKIFIRVAASVMGSQRAGDQYGTLLAGYWCLCNDHVPTQQEATALMNAYNWDEHTEDTNHKDSVEAIQTIMATKIRIASNEYSVAELVRDACVQKNTGLVEQRIAYETLARHGIKVELVGVDYEIWFGITNKNLKHLIKDTQFSTDVRGQLLRIDGAKRLEGTKSFAGTASRVIAIPLSAALSEDVSEYDSYPL